MSGIEVAGLLLGSIPILVEAVSAYKDGIQKSRIFFRKRAIVEKLSLALLLQQRTLAEIIRSILTRSGCLDVWRLEADPVGCFHDSEIQAQVLEYLGEDNEVAFKGVLRQSYDTIRRIALNLAGLVGATQVRADRQVATLPLLFRVFRQDLANVDWQSLKIKCTRMHPDPARVAFHSSFPEVIFSTFER